MISALYVLTLITVFAGIGRLSIPRRERAPLSTWTLRDVYFNVRRGLAVVSGYGPPDPASMHAGQPLGDSSPGR
ncbi:hypothetical protein [Arthrobacter sp. H41]|uniref:hypothetical protein n=1 Tax=Arthrobacter sp. H41 TaxID=1312978 RepID=UPI00047C0B30|nr:hypothetical protein [Arthrobacter sp. H41]